MSRTEQFRCHRIPPRARRFRDRRYRCDDHSAGRLAARFYGQLVYVGVARSAVDSGVHCEDCIESSGIFERRRISRSACWRKISGPCPACLLRKSADKFAQVAWHARHTGAPVMDGAAASFDCDTHDVVDAGDHIILIGRVVDFTHTSSTPLGYCRGAYVDFSLSNTQL